MIQHSDVKPGRKTLIDVAHQLQAFPIRQAWSHPAPSPELNLDPVLIDQVQGCVNTDGADMLQRSS